MTIRGEAYVGVARRHARGLGRRLGWHASAAEALATAVSEIARNIVVHAGNGEILFDVVLDCGRRGAVVVARDRGPVIPDVERAMQDGYSTAGGLGLEMPSVRRLVDELEVTGGVGGGTTVVIRKWGR